MKFSIVVPAFNEFQSVRTTATELVARYPEAEVIIVDDGSTDGTAAALEGSGARVLTHSRNRGYGASLKTGLRAASHDVIVFCDADGQHDPADIDRLLQAMEGASMVVGARRKRLHSRLWRMPGKWFLGWMASYLTRTAIPDLNSGLRAIRRDVALRFIDICPNGFSMSSTLTIAALSEYEVRFVPIDVRPRAPRSRSTVRVRTGVDTIFLILRLATLFEPLRVFLPLATFFIIGGLAWGIPYVLLHEGVSVGAMLLIVTGVLTFFFGLLADQNNLLRRRGP